LVRSLTQTARGTIINVHEYGATARLEDGSLAAIPAAEFAANRPTYVSSRDKRKPLELRVVRIGRHATASLANVERDPDAIIAEPPSPEQLDELSTRTDIAFEMRLGAYLRETEAWAPSDRPAPAERHFIRKKHRADVFEARNKTT
jgi:hypothetical protein